MRVNVPLKEENALEYRNMHCKCKQRVKKQEKFGRNKEGNDECLCSFIVPIWHWMLDNFLADGDVIWGTDECSTEGIMKMTMTEHERSEELSRALALAIINNWNYGDT